uniref:HEXIM P-TEFb complex subunit 1 n=1 Tax=Cairina moschata TaxID=8855 RepID=A0A8C3CNX1_CAIMO
MADATAAEPQPPSAAEPQPERGEQQPAAAADGEAGRLPAPGTATAAEEEEEAATAAEGAGGAEGRPAEGGAARPGLGPRYRAAVGRAEEWPAKKKHRRRPSKKKRRWKPYSKLSWEEKQQFDERQSLRASRLRAEMFAKGQPVAPYNTTQFLMEDHDQEEAAEEDGGSDGMGGDGSEFLQRDFSETYERYHVESLQNMSKQELVKEYLELEKCLSRMEDENNRLRMESKKYGGEAAEAARVRQLELEVDRLRAENLQLLKEKDLHRQGGFLQWWDVTLYTCVQRRRRTLFTTRNRNKPQPCIGLTLSL